MSETSDFDVSSFQSQIIQDYKVLKGFREIDSRLEQPSESYLNSTSSQSYFVKFIWSVFFRIFGVLEKRAVQGYYKKPDIVGYTNRSREIVSHPDMKKLLCPILAEKISPGTFDEEKEIKVTKILTSILTQKEIADGFSIDTDPHLFAFMLNEIMQEGIDNYCHQ